MITSTRNQHVAFLRSLHRTKTRREAGAFLVEGVRLSHEALAGGASVRLGLYDAGALSGSPRNRQLLELLKGLPNACEASPHVIQAAAETRSPAGVVLAVDEPLLPPVSSIADAPFLLILDGIADPGNAGAILRSAAAAGVKTVVFTEGSVDPYEAKAVRAAMGAHFKLAIVRAGGDALNPHLAAFPRRIGAGAGAADTIYEADWTEPVALFLGSEAHGLSPEAERILTSTARIPMAPGVESLNVAMAAAVILFHARRDKVGQAP